MGRMTKTATTWSAALGVLVFLPPIPVERDASMITPAQSREHCILSPGGRRSTGMLVDDDVTRIHWATEDCQVEIRIEGDVEWDDHGTGWSCPAFVDG